MERQIDDASDMGKSELISKWLKRARDKADCIDPLTQICSICYFEIFHIIRIKMFPRNSKPLICFHVCSKTHAINNGVSGHVKPALTPCIHNILAVVIVDSTESPVTVEGFEIL